MRNPPRPVKQPRLGSITSDRLFDEDSELSEGSEHSFRVQSSSTSGFPFYMLLYRRLC
jgi:hypothetical protein